MSAKRSFFFLLFFTLAYTEYAQNIIVGAERMSSYLPLFKNKRIALVANQTSRVQNTHLVDTLRSLNIKLVKIFSPEHGFRGLEDAGAHIKNGIDEKTGIPIVSLYGSNKKPKASDVKDVDIIVFDIQDVGARFYTYISTMHYMMEVCAENNVKFLVLDRPNPNGFYVDGPVLQDKFKSFVGMHPIPVVHGLTVGELAEMINEEGWLSNYLKCDLMIIKCLNYTHTSRYELPVKPSPNLPNMSSIYLYPSLCFFEGTIVSVGRGTETPFQMIGYPQLDSFEVTFTPQSTSGSKSPMYQNVECRGFNLQEFGVQYIKKSGGLYLHWLIEMHKHSFLKEKFFSQEKFFDLLAGTDQLRHQIMENWSEERIKETWVKDLVEYKILRKKYLLYPDFE